MHCCNVCRVWQGRIMKVSFFLECHNLDECFSLFQVDGVASFKGAYFCLSDVFFSNSANKLEWLENESDKL